jgi:hypothetical protein
MYVAEEVYYFNKPPPHQISNMKYTTTRTMAPELDVFEHNIAQDSSSNSEYGGSSSDVFGEEIDNINVWDEEGFDSSKRIHRAARVVESALTITAASLSPPHQTRIMKDIHFTPLKNQHAQQHPQTPDPSPSRPPRTPLSTSRRKLSQLPHQQGTPPPPSPPPTMATIMSPVASIERRRRSKSDQIETLLGELGAKSRIQSLQKPPITPRTLASGKKLWPGTMPLPPSMRERDANIYYKTNEEINHSRRTGHGSSSNHARRGSDSGARSTAMDPFDGAEEENGSFLIDRPQKPSDTNPAAAAAAATDDDNHDGLHMFVHQSRKEVMDKVLKGISSSSENMSSIRGGKMRRRSSLPSCLAQQAAAAAASRRVGEGARLMSPRWASSTMVTASTHNDLDKLSPEWDNMNMNDVFREIKTYKAGRRPSLNGRGSAHHPPLPSPRRYSRKTLPQEDKIDDDAKSSNAIPFPPADEWSSSFSRDNQFFYSKDTFSSNGAAKKTPPPQVLRRKSDISVDQKSVFSNGERSVRSSPRLRKDHGEQAPKSPRISRGARRLNATRLLPPEVDDDSAATSPEAATATATPAHSLYSSPPNIVEHTLTSPRSSRGARRSRSAHLLFPKMEGLAPVSPEAVASPLNSNPPNSATRKIRYIRNSEVGDEKDDKSTRSGKSKSSRANKSESGEKSIRSRRSSTRKSSFSSAFINKSEKRDDLGDGEPSTPRKTSVSAAPIKDKIDEVDEFPERKNRRPSVSSKTAAETVSETAATPSSHTTITPHRKIKFIKMADMPSVPALDNEDTKSARSGADVKSTRSKGGRASRRVSRNES